MKSEENKSTAVRKILFLPYIKGNSPEKSQINNQEEVYNLSLCQQRSEQRLLVGEKTQWRLKPRSLSPKLRKMSPSEISKQNSIKKICIISSFPGEQNIETDDSSYQLSQLLVESRNPSINFEQKGKVESEFESQRVYFQKYQNIDRSLDRNQLFNRDNSPLERAINTAIDQNLIPQSVGIFKTSSSSIINSNHQKIGQSYNSILNSFIKENNELKKIYISDNRFNELEIGSLIQNFPNSTEQVDLSSNSVSTANLEILQRKLNENRSFHLKNLNLEKCNLKDNEISHLSVCLPEFTHLLILNLSRNKFSSPTAIFSLGQSISSLSKLQELYLHWNNIIGGEIGETLLSGIHRSKSLRVLDLSFNRLGRTDSSLQRSMKMICRILEENNLMVHLDLSNNLFENEDFELLQESLSKNNSCHVHLDAKGWYMDAMGYLNPEIHGEASSGQFPLVAAHPVTELGMRRIQGVRKIAENQEFQHVHDLEPLPFKTGDNCWICDGWIEYDILWNLRSGNLGSNLDKLFIHLQIDDFRPSIMSNMKKIGCFFIKRVLPPNTKILYFFSSNGKIENRFLAEDAQIIQLKKLEAFSEITQIQNQRRFSITDQQILNFNIFRTQPNPEFQLYNNQYNLNATNMIRQVFDGQETSNKQKTAKWFLSQSMWAGVQLEDDEFNQKCLDFDYENSRIKLICFEDSDSQMKVKISLKRSYPHFKRAFRILSFQNVIDEIPCLPFKAFSEFAQKSGILNKNFKLSDLDIVFQETVQHEAKSGGKLHIEHTLNRHLFIQIFIRIAEAKYLETEHASNLEEAFQNLMVDGLFQRLKSFENPQYWRSSFFWEEKCEKSLQFYMPVIKYAFTQLQISSKRKSFGANSNKGVYLEEFQKFVADIIENISGVFNEEEVEKIFATSTACYVDEIFSDKHLQLTLLEFCEALARVSFQKIQWVFENYNSLNDYLEDQQTGINSQRKIQIQREDEEKAPILHKKIEAICFVIYNKYLVFEDFRILFTFPSTTIWN